MIRLFLRYSPLKPLLVLVVLLAVRLSALRAGIPMTEPELNWMLAGERMSEGYTLYKDIWTELEPFSAITYNLIDLIFGKSSLVYFIISLLLVYVQALMFNYTLNKNKIFKESTMLPALTYVLFSSLFFDFYTLSPILLGTTFLIWAFNLICIQSRIERGEDLFFYIGLLAGIASLFYLPFALFLIFSILALGLYSSTDLRKHLIMVLAFFFPYIILLIYYFWIDNIPYYYQFAIKPVFNGFPDFLTSIRVFVKILALPLLILLAALAAIVMRGKYIHYQYKIIKIAGMWILISAVALLAEKSFAPHVLMLFVPPLAFFSAHLFIITSRNKIFSELFFTAIFGGILIISFYALDKPDNYTRDNLIETMPETMAKLSVKDKKILVFGNEKGYYQGNRLAGPYLNWKLSAWQFDDLSKYRNITYIYQVIEADRPDYIVDRENLMDEISSRIPFVQKSYKRVGTSEIYSRQN